MNNIYKIVVLILGVMLFSSCSKKYPDLPTVQNVDINRYLGTWYEIARYEHFFEKGCRNVTANYSLKDNGDIKVINKCTKIETGEKTEANGVAYSTNETNTKLKVSFFRPFWGDYWVFDLASDYSYALVGTPSKEYLWILSRESKISDELKSKILTKIKTLGFETDKLIWTIQD